MFKGSRAREIVVQMNPIKYYTLRLRDTLFPPTTTHDWWMFRLGKGKYSYISEKRDDDIRDAWGRR